MSRAFVKELDGVDAVEDLPDKLISSHPNLVTEEGLAAIEAEVARLESELAEAQGSDDRAAVSRVQRDLRYWSQRQASAELMPKPTDVETVQFGSTVALMRSDGRRQKFRIVGEDEADPAKGTLSYASPLAQALMGKSAGAEVKVAASETEILAIT